MRSQNLESLLLRVTRKSLEGIDFLPELLSNRNKTQVLWMHTNRFVSRHLGFGACIHGWFGTIHDATVYSLNLNSTYSSRNTLSRDSHCGIWHTFVGSKFTKKTAELATTLADGWCPGSTWSSVRTEVAKTVRNFLMEVFRFTTLASKHVFCTTESRLRLLECSIEIMPNGSLTDTGRPRHMSSRLLTKMAVTLDSYLFIYTLFVCGICNEANFCFRANLLLMCRTALSLHFQFG